MFVAVIEVLRLRRIRSISHAACTEVCAGSIALIADGAGKCLEREPWRLGLATQRRLMNPVFVAEAAVPHRWEQWSRGAIEVARLA
jgi:hypothetical protein